MTSSWLPACASLTLLGSALYKLHVGRSLTGHVTLIYKAEQKPTGTLAALTCCSMALLQLKLMTSWAVVCDVYFLEPTNKRKGESSQQFAERVQGSIAQRANLRIAPWDGYLKYYNLGVKVSFHKQMLVHGCAMGQGFPMSSTSVQWTFWK